MKNNQKSLFSGFDAKKPIQLVLDGFSATEKLFFERLPKRPYCTDDLQTGLLIRPKETAIQFRYLQFNPPFLLSHLIFDIDQGEESCYAWERANLAEPNCSVINTENGNCHSIYTLSAPVLTTDFASQKPIKYLHAITSAYKELLKADLGYSGLISKSIFPNSGWRQMRNHTHLFSLEDLGKHVDFKRFAAHKINYAEVGLGRNCTIFNRARKWSYVAIREYRADRLASAFEEWSKRVLLHCRTLNGEFSQPMEANEVRHIAKSIAKWTWANDPSAHKAFLETQSFRGKLSLQKRTQKRAEDPLEAQKYSQIQILRGKRSGQARQEKIKNKREEALRMLNCGISMHVVAEKMGINRSTLWRWKMLQEPNQNQISALF